MRARLAIACACAALVACSKTATVYVDVHGDLRVGTEVARIDTELYEGFPPSDSPAARHERVLAPDAPLLVGVRAAEIDGVATGEVTVRVLLRDASEAIVVDRLVRASVEGDTVLTVWAGRACAGVTCAPSLTCVGGMCADPSCAPTEPGRCDDLAGGALRSCADIHTVLPHATTGMYAIDPDGSGSMPVVPVWCEMEVAGGGFTLVGRSADTASGAFGWTVATGSVDEDRTPYSLGPLVAALGAREILVASYTTGKQIDRAYLLGPLPEGFVDALATSAVAVDSTTVLGDCDPPGGPGMLSYVGHTSSRGIFFFRDQELFDESFGLDTYGWNTNYPVGEELCNGEDDDCDGAFDEGFAAGTCPPASGDLCVGCARGGALDRHEGVLFVR